MDTKIGLLPWFCCALETTFIKGRLSAIKVSLEYSEYEEI